MAHHTGQVPTRARGFTLVELLVVIGIIALLVGILLPVIGKVRTSARAASTQASIATLVAGIEAYHQTFGAYPSWLVKLPMSGINPPEILVSGGGTAALTDSENGGASLTPTPTESMLLWMVGGLNITPSPVTFSYSKNSVGQGPVDLSPLKNYKRYKNMIGTTPKMSDGLLNQSGSYYAAKGINDTSVPEFVDDFSPGMPILYLPANAGANGVFYLVGGTNSETYAANAQYDLTYAKQYYGLDQNPDSTTFPGGWNQYLGDPNSKNGSGVYTQARQKDGYILISAGPDGKYGTKDDITNFGTPGQ